MADIKVSITSIKDKANSFKTIAESIRQYADEMKNVIDGLRSSWEGTAADATRKEYEALQAAFEEKYKRIMNFVTFLENAAENYTFVENTNTQ